jgi:hypothetical protein
MKKEEIIKELNISFDKLLHLMKNHEDHKFSEVLIEGKWTAGQHVEHLRMSTAPINTILKLPKFIIKYKWGTCNRPERNFEELVDKYAVKLQNLAEGVTAPSKFMPRFVSASEKEVILDKLDNERHKMIKLTEKWDEKALSKYVIPHPLLGKLSVREMLYFTILHTDHHRQILKNRY